ncbi:retrovirus-related pol polyprotein from transposon TNT 1-94 [Tanacetum coccineum]
MINDSRTNNNNHLVPEINNQSFEINDLKVQLQDKIHVSSLVKEREHIKLEYKNLHDSIKQRRTKTKLQTDSLQQKLNDHIYENNKLRAQLKTKFLESQLNQNGTSVNTKFTKPPTSGTKLYSVTLLPKSKVIPKVVEKNDLTKTVTSHLTTNKIIEKCTKVHVACLLKIKSEPINTYFKNNRIVHQDYLKVTKELVATLQELLEEARALKPIDEHIGRVSSTNASGSRPRSNTKNDRIQRTSSRSKKNKVEAHHRKFKSSANKNNHVSDCNANVKNVALSKNSDIICISCNECLFSANHDACVVKYLKDMQKCKKAKSVKQKEKKQWKPTGRIVEIVLWYLDSRCSKHMAGHRDKLINFVSKFIGTVRFGNDHFAAIMGYIDLQMRNILISRVYYVEGLWHNLFPVRQFCDSDLEVAFRKHTCFVRKLEGVDLLSGSRGSNLYTISMADMMKSSPVCLLSKASKTKSWLWHRRLSYLNFGIINHLAKEGLVKGIVDDYSWFTWVKFLRTKDEAPEIIIKFLKQAQVSLKATVRYLRTNNGTEFINQTLQNYTEDLGLTHHTSTARTLQQNSVVERRNRTLVEAVRTILIFFKSLLILWVEVVATACYTQNRSLIHTRYNKTPYELLRDRKPELKYLYVFGALCYPTNDFEDLGKLYPKADIGIFIGYSPSKKAYRIYNKRTRQTMETMNAQFDELTQMASEQHGLGPELHDLTSGHINLLFQPMFNEYFKPPSAVSTPIFAATLPPPDTTGASSSTSIDKDAPSPIFDSDTFANPFSPPVTSSAESSLRIVDTSNMHTFQQPQINTKRWIRDHPLVTIIDNLSKPVSTRRQLTTDALWCYFHAFLVKEEPKNYKEDMIESSWFEAMQEEIHEFD